MLRTSQIYAIRSDDVGQDTSRTTRRDVAALVNNFSNGRGRIEHDDGEVHDLEAVDVAIFLRCWR